MILRLIVVLIVMFVFSNCDEFSSSELTTQDPDNSILGTWYLSEKNVVVSDFNNNFDTIYSVYTTNDSSYCIMDIKNDFSIVYLNYIETWIDTNTFYISDDTIYTEKISYGLPFECEHNSLTVYVCQAERNIVYKYLRYNDNEIPPSNWPSISLIKGDLVTSFYPDYSESD